MEENMTRAIFIAVTVFISMIALSLVMLYYNTAKEAADKLTARQDIAQTFDDIVTNFNLYNRQLNGVELRSLIRKYANDESVLINIVSISGVATSENIYININNNGHWINEDGIVMESMLSIINPAWSNMVNKIEPANPQDKTLILEVKLDD